MNRHRTRSATGAARIGAWPLLALAMAASAPMQAAQAQLPSVQDYRLPPASPSPSPTAAGPVDSENPVVRPVRPATEAPTPAPRPVRVVPVRPTPAAEPRANPARAEPRAERSARGQAEPEAAPAPAATPTAAPAPPPPPEIPSVPAANAPAEAPPPAAAAQAESGYPWPRIAALAALVLLGGGLLAWRRRQPPAPEPEHAPSAEPAPSPPAPPSPPSRSPPAPARDPRPAAAPAPEPPSAAPQPLELVLEPRHFSRAMVNASLAYRLTLVNHTGAPAGPFRIAGDIVSAHASLPTTEQLAPADAALATIHEVAALAPGESATLRGELRLPIASILPIQSSGGARVFVPLARFRAEAKDGSATTRVFVIGQTSDQPGGPLRPFPLDRGPGVDRAIGQRELAVPA